MTGDGRGRCAVAGDRGDSGSDRRHLDGPGHRHRRRVPPVAALDAPPPVAAALDAWQDEVAARIARLIGAAPPDDWAALADALAEDEGGAP